MANSGEFVSKGAGDENITDGALYK